MKHYQGISVPIIHTSAIRLSLVFAIISLNEQASSQDAKSLTREKVSPSSTTLGVTMVYDGAGVKGRIKKNSRCFSGKQHNLFCCFWKNIGKNKGYTIGWCRCERHIKKIRCFSGKQLN